MCVYSFWSFRRPIRRKWAVMSQCQHFMVNSSISECDHKCETQNAEPEIGTNGSSETWQNPRVGGYGSRFGPPGIRWLSFWTGLELNWPIFAVQTQTAGGLPGPIGNTSNRGKFAIPATYAFRQFAAGSNFFIRRLRMCRMSLLDRCTGGEMVENIGWLTGWFSTSPWEDLKCIWWLHFLF